MSSKSNKSTTLAATEAEIKSKAKAAPAKEAPKAEKKVAKEALAPVAESTTTAIPKHGLETANVGIEQVTIKKGFNPRSDLGDISVLKAGIKESGLLNPITVVPAKGKGAQFYVLAGHRRFTAISELGWKTVPVVIRRDLEIDSAEAKALAVMENSEEGRSNLSELDQANTFQKLMDTMGTEAAVAKACGYSLSYVKRQIKLLAVPKDVKKKLAEGTISKRTALAIVDAPEEVREKIAKQVSDGTTEADVRKMVGEAKKDIAPVAADKPHKPTKKGEESKHNRPIGVLPGQVCVARTTKELRDDIRKHAAEALNASEFDAHDERTGNPNAGDEEAYAFHRTALAALWYALGVIPTLDYKTQEFEAALDDAEKRLTELMEQTVEKATEKHESKKAKAEKKAAKPSKKAKPAPAEEADEDGDADE